MALSAKAGHFIVNASDTVGTTINVTAGFQPKAIVLWGMGRSEAVDTIGAASHRRAIGFGVSDTDRRSLTQASENGAAAADADSYHTNARCYIVTDSDGVEEGGLDLSAIASWPADGFQVIVDDQFATSQRIHYLALGGTDITNVKSGQFTAPLVTGEFDVTDPGFQPDVVLFLMPAILTSAPPSGRSNGSSFAFGAAVSSTQQAVLANATDEGSATMDTGAYLVEGPECIGCQDLANPLGLSRRYAYVSSIATGFRLNQLEGTTAVYLHYLALKGIQARVGSVLTQTDTTTDIVASGFGFSPEAVLFFSACRAESTVDVGTAHDEWSIGAATSATERLAQGLIDENGTANAEITTALEFDEVYINIADAGDTLDGLMDYKSKDADGFTCIMDDADPSASMVAYVAFGPTAAGPSTVLQDVIGLGVVPFPR